MDNFLFHKVSDKEKQEIKKQAKDILDNFSKELSKIKREIKEPVFEKEKSEREEGKKEKCEVDIKTVFENAPKKNKDFIIAEKGGWQ